jgi:TonB family protein
VVRLFSEKKYDEALAFSKNAWDIAARNNLISNAKVLPALRNLAEIHLVKGKESEAINVLQIVTNEYEKMGDKGKAELEKVISRLAFAYASKKDFKNAEAQYLKLKSLTEAAYGEKSRQSADVNFTLANIYNLQNKEAEAEAYYLKAILTNDEILSKKEKETREDVDIYECFVFHQEYKKTGLKDTNGLFKEFYKKRGIPEDRNLSLGVVNGKAVNLFVPKYPESAKAKRAAGFAIVKVDIDEQGSITKAKATCGFLDFVEAVEGAALKSKFSPTLMNGQPVKVTGYIVYKFVAR